MLCNSRRGPGPLGYTLVTLTLMIGAVLASGWRGMGVLMATVLLMLWLRPEAFAIFRSWRIWTVAALLLLSAALWGAADTSDLSPLTIGIQALVRGLTVLLALNGYLRAVGLGDLALMFEQLGVQGLGFALGVALNMLPSLAASAGNTFAALRMRGGLRRRPWHTLRGLLVTILVNGLRRGDEITAAAESRGYNPAQPFQRRLRMQRADWYWGLTTLVTVGLLLGWP